MGTTAEHRTGIVVLGEDVLIQGFALAGARAVEADGADQVRRRWAMLRDDTAIVVLTPAAASALGPLRTSPDAPMTVVMPT